VGNFGERDIFGFNWLETRVLKLTLQMATQKGVARNGMNAGELELVPHCHELHFVQSESEVAEGIQDPHDAPEQGEALAPFDRM